MKKLQERIISDGKIYPGNILKVDGFINHQIDVELVNDMALEFKKRFEGVEIDRILTIEASGIALAVIAAQHFKVPVVFAKKGVINTLGQDLYQADVYSYTKAQTFRISVSQSFIHAGEKVLILDDFLANGLAVNGLLSIIQQANAECVGVGIAIEKGFQDGGKLLRSQKIKLESLAIIQSMHDQTIQFTTD